MKERSENEYDYERFLKSFGRLLPLKKKPKTLLEIARFPRSELAHSNILSFFLNPNEEHGLGCAFLKSLLETARSHLATEEIGEVEVIPEDPTDSKKRIDIVVVGQSFLLGIEHKIDARVDNPLSEYRSRLKNRAEEKQIPNANLALILLCVKEVTRKDLSGFKPITYKKFFNALEPRLKQTSNARNKVGCQYAREFVTTIKNLTEGTHMDKRFSNLIKKDQKIAVKLFHETNTLLKELQDKRDEFMKEIVVHAPFGKMRTWDSKQDKENYMDDFFSMALTDVDVERKLSLRLTACIYLDRWEICVEKWRGTQTSADKWFRALSVNKKTGVFKKLPSSADIEEVRDDFLELKKAIQSRLKDKSNR